MSVSDRINVMGKGIYFVFFDEERQMWIVVDAAGRECFASSDKSGAMDWAVDRIAVLTAELVEPIEPGGPLRNCVETDPKNGDVVISDYATGVERARGATLPLAWLALIDRLFPQPGLRVMVKLES